MLGFWSKICISSVIKMSTMEVMFKHIVLEVMISLIHLIRISSANQYFRWHSRIKLSILFRFLSSRLSTSKTMSEGSVHSIVILRTSLIDFWVSTENSFSWLRHLVLCHTSITILSHIWSHSFNLGMLLIHNKTLRSAFMMSTVGSICSVATDSAHAR